MIRCPGCTYLGTRDRSFPADTYAELYDGNRAYLKRIADARAAAAAAEPWTTLDRFKAKAMSWLDDDGRRGRLLDVGCGPGGFLIAARGLGWDVAGIEPAPAAAAAAVELGIPVFTGTLDDQDAPAGPFDAITAFEVLEHVGDPVRVLRGMARALGPDGRIVMSMPNLGDANLLAQSNPEDVPPIHLSFFNRSSLSAAASRAGLRVERVYTHPVATTSLRNVYGSGWKYRLPREGVRAVLGRTDGSPMLAMLRRP
jgi:2-polyprenyl-3-methyl-5-hydroxy-6-metoxy-1,4-benzoquinol methylase